LKLNWYKSTLRTRLSPPARGRGLKHQEAAQVLAENAVAPRTGAWIETNLPSTPCPGGSVAPRTGAWIETLFFWQRRF